MDDLILDIQTKKKQLDALRPLDPKALSSLEAWYDVELTFTSNALEGNTLTRSETAIVIEKGLTVRGKPLKDHEEAIDHFEALQYVRQLVKDQRPIRESDVRDLHKLVLARSNREEAGIYSQHQCFISGSNVKLPSPEDVPRLMDEFGSWLSGIKPSAENAIKAHLDLVSIHPFSDGNSRTARLLMNLILMRASCPPLIIHPEDRPDYIDALELAQQNEDAKPYYDFMYKVLLRSIDAYLSLAAK